MRGRERLAAQEKGEREREINVKMRKKRGGGGDLS